MLNNYIFINGLNACDKPVTAEMSGNAEGKMADERSQTLAI
jgi:hypothetical protein